MSTVAYFTCKVSSTMLFNYFKSAFRNLAVRKVYPFINVLGLTLGIATCLILFALIHYQLSFDHFHAKAARTYRVTQHISNTTGTRYSGTTPYPLGAVLRKELPQLEEVTQTHYLRSASIIVNNTVFEENGVLFTEPAYFRIFDFPLLPGGSVESLAEPNTVLLSKQLADKYFPGNASPVGKLIQMTDGEALKVAGVLENIPLNTNLPFSMVVSFATFRQSHKDLAADWTTTWGAGYTLFTAAPATNVRDLERQLETIRSRYAATNGTKKVTFHVQPLTDIHTNPVYGHGMNYVAPLKALWALGLLGFLILLIACINFINLTTAHAIDKAKEVAIRKVMGGGRRHVIGQSLTETALLTFVATLLALLVTACVLPALNNQVPMVKMALRLTPTSVLFALVVVGVVTLMAGLYPAWVVSGYPAVSAMQKNLQSGPRGLVLRKGLIVLQFGFAQIMLISTLVIGLQLDYFKHKDLGFYKERVLNVKLPESLVYAEGDKQSKFDGLRQQFLREAGVQSVTFSTSRLLAQWASSMGSEQAGDVVPAILNYVDGQYLQTFGLQLVAGRNFQPRLRADSLRELIVNEKLVAQLGLRGVAAGQTNQAAVGRIIPFDDNKRGIIVGVIKDFHNMSLQEDIRPNLFIHNPAMFRMVSIRLAAGSPAPVVQRLETTWKRLFPNLLFSYEWEEELIRRDYLIEDFLFKVARVAALISLLVGCLGIYGLVLFVAVQRTREIGIRKVLGATVNSIVTLLAKDFLVLVLLANLFAWPLAWMMMNKWLQGFSYRIDLKWWMLWTPGLVSLLIALLTVCYHTVKAAIANPVKSIRSA